MNYTRILATGSYLPKKVLDNHDLEKMVDTSHDWIVERTGIHRRHIACDHETTSWMGAEAAKQALARAGLSANDIELIIVGTTTPDMVFPSAACLVQQHLGVHGIGAFDVSAACSGFIYALNVADQYIRAGSIRRALVIGSEVMSRITDWSDRGTCVLFGDGAGAVVVEASHEPGILATRLHADARQEQWLYCKRPQVYAGSLEPGYMQMQGNEVFKMAVHQLSHAVDETLAAAKLDRRAVDWLIPHQANIRIIQAIAKKLQLSMDHVVLTLAEHGNTSSASIPLALDSAVTSGQVTRGQTLLLEAFGGGFTWGSALVRY